MPVIPIAPPDDTLERLTDDVVRLRPFREDDVAAIVKQGYDETTVRRVVKMITQSEYKRRQAPPGLRVTSKAFGEGWRMPIATGKMIS